MYSLAGCIRATVRPRDSTMETDLVYQLDYASVSSPEAFIEVYSTPDAPPPVFTFSIEAKDGAVKTVRVDDELEEKLSIRGVGKKEVRKREDEVVMTDGCSLCVRPFTLFFSLP
jgi:hypothetical protein